MANPVFEVVRTVLAVRDFKSDPVPDEIVRRIVEAGRLTASGGNGQPWHFVVVRRRETLMRIGELAPTGRYTANAAGAIVVAVEKENRIAVADGSRAIQSMILTAWSEGVGTNWVGFSSLDAVRALVALPDKYQVMAVLPLGYPTHRLDKGVKNRKPMSEVASLEEFGKPL